MAQQRENEKTRIHTYWLPEGKTLKRRQFLSTALALSAGALVVAACGANSGTDAPLEGVPLENTPPSTATNSPGATPTAGAGPIELPPALANAEPYSAAATDELGDPLNTFKQITTYNNYYEFALDKEGPALAAQRFEPLPWWVEVTGLVNKPRTFEMSEIYTLFPHEERVYRLRCVEAWSMVIPWVGFPLARLLEVVEPKPEAKFVKFTSVMRPEQMPNQRLPILVWPYTEGLRMDEAMNPLAILATGMYGKPLTNQQGAPIRLVVPWKYGFKSVKAITKIELVETMPMNTWREAAPDEYGFYANVNPQVNHPRWSQASERRIGQVGRRETLMFNGYEEKVQDLYAGMDLRENF